jgi:hypothetical protein
MTRLDFMAACAAAHVAPAVALECPEIRDALRARDAARVIALLQTNF